MEKHRSERMRMSIAIILLGTLSLSIWPYAAIAGWLDFATTTLDIIGEADNHGAVGAAANLASLGIDIYQSAEARKRAAANKARVAADFAFLEALVARTEAKKQQKKQQARLEAERRQRAQQQALMAAKVKQWRAEQARKLAAWKFRMENEREDREIQAALRRQAMRKAMERARREAAERARRIAAERERRLAAERKRRRIAYEAYKKRRAERMIVASVQSVEAGKRMYLDRFLASLMKGKTARELNEREKYALKHYRQRVQQTKSILDARMANAQRNVTSASATLNGLATSSALGQEASSALTNWTDIITRDDAPATRVIHIQGEVVNTR